MRLGLGGADTMVAQQFNYPSLLDRLAASSDTLSETLAAEANRNDNDVFRVMVLAEQAMKLRQWQAAALLFARVTLGAANSPYDEADLVKHAEHIVLLTTQQRGPFNWSTDLLLYGHRRMVAALVSDGLQPSRRDEWIIAAFGALLHQATDAEKEAVRNVVAVLHPGNYRISKHYQTEIGPASQHLTCGLAAAATAAPTNQPEGFSVFLLLIATLGSISLGYWLSDWLSFPGVSRLLDGRWYGTIVRTAFMTWPFLLAATWAFGLYASIATRTRYFVSPYHLIRHHIAAGQITPFNRDLFFHIFQFVWVAFLVVTWLLFKEYQDLPIWLPSIWKSPPFDTNSYLQHLDCIKLRGDIAALFLAAVFCAGSVWNQRRIQTLRIATQVDVYWWDSRINPAESLVRRVMVGVDMFLATFLVTKVVIIVWVIYGLVKADALSIHYFSPDGVGGLKHLTNMLMYLSWIAFIFGVFVIASLYLHWNLRAYRWGDFGLIGAYVVLVIVALVPLEILEYRLGSEKQTQLESLAKDPAPGAKLEETAQYIENVNKVRDWNVSAWKIGILGNPVLPLGFQFLVMAFQTLGRLGKLPKLPIPGLSDDDGNGGKEAA
jgi:hypothetical protein